MAEDSPLPGLLFTSDHTWNLRHKRFVLGPLAPPPRFPLSFLFLPPVPSLITVRVLRVSPPSR